MLEKDILARLQNGEDVEAIANELINMVNSANDKFQKEKEAEKVNMKKITDLQTILDLIHDFCLEYYCEDDKDIDVLEKAFEDLTAEKVLKQVEDIADSVIKFLDGGVFQFTIPTPKKPAIGNKDADQILKHFLRTMGL